MANGPFCEAASALPRVPPERESGVLAVALQAYARQLAGTGPLVEGGRSCSERVRVVGVRARKLEGEGCMERPFS